MDKYLELITYCLPTTILAGVAGYLIRLIIEQRLAIERIKKNIKITEYNKAAAKLRSAFAPALASIYLAKKHGSTHEVPDVDKFLRNAILCHAAAIEMFRIFVPKNRRVSYQEAWEKYRYEVWNYGFEAEKNRTDIDDPSKIFEDLIHDILQFADDEL